MQSEITVYIFAPSKMVVVAQLVELQIVVLAVVGSIPIDHPKSRQRKLPAFFMHLKMALPKVFD